MALEIFDHTSEKDSTDHKEFIKKIMHFDGYKLKLANDIIIILHLVNTHVIK